MAISQVSQGVFVVSPNEVATLTGTAGSEYLSVFTKERAKQWELAQKQALMKEEAGAKRYAAEMELYRARVLSTEKRRAELEQMKLDVAAGRLKAKDAAAIAAMREAGDRQRQLADWEAKKAETMALPGGSTTTRTGGGGGGGGRATTPGGAARLSPEEQMEIGGAVSSGAGDVAVTAEDYKGRRETGALVSTTQEDTDLQNVALIDNLTAQRTSSTKDAATARAEVMDELVAAGHGDIVDSAMNVEAPPTTTGGGGAPSTTTTTRAGSRQVQKRPDLGTIPDVPNVPPPTVADEKTLIEDINKQLQALSAGPAPTYQAGDFITDARGIMAGRFGPTLPSPAYQQRNVLDVVLRDRALGGKLLEEYRKQLPPQAPAAAPTAAPTAPAGAVPVSVPVTPVEAPVPSLRVPETGVGLPSRRTPTRQEMLEQNIMPQEQVSVPGMYETMEDYKAAQASRAALAEAIANTQMVGPGREPGVPAGFPPTPQFPAPQAAALPPIEVSGAKLSAQRMAELSALGVKPEAVLPRAPAAAPSSAGAAPKEAAALDLRGRPLAGVSPGQQEQDMQRFERQAAGAAKAEDVRTAAKAGAEGTIMGVGPKAEAVKTGKGPAFYLSERYTAALALKDKPEKLKRLTASGPGKVAYELFKANKATNAPFNKTWEQITLTFAGKPDDMKAAHEVAIALNETKNIPE